MELYIARQPIFDKDMQVVAYELLYRSDKENASSFVDGDDATLSVINNAALSLDFDTLTNSKRGFINFTYKLICDEIPTLFAPENVVIEVLEDVVPDEILIEALKRLKGKGYVIALDDFVYGSIHESLFGIVDIVKVDFMLSSESEKKKIVKELSNGKIKFLAEKVETKEEFHSAVKMGYTYFQGYFFSKPVMVSGKGIKPISSIFIQVLGEISKEDPEFRVLTSLIESDLSLSYKLLRLINSGAFYSISKIDSIHQAVVKLGLRELKKWITIVMMKEISNGKPDELLRQSLVRAKLFESVVNYLGMPEARNEAFLVGLFSMIDVIMERPLEDIVKELPLSDDIKGGLLGKNPVFNRILEIIKSYERAEWQEFETLCVESKVLPQMVFGEYYKALGWVSGLTDDQGI